ncbi:MAG: polymerase [Mycobacteriales bacterium]
MQVAVVPSRGGAGLLRALTEAGEPDGPVQAAPDLAAAVAEREARHRPRWVWAATAEAYPALYAAGARVDRCHDLALTEALLLGCAGRWGEPRGLAAAWARQRGLPVPPDPPARARDAQPALFEPAQPGPADDAERLAAVVGVYAGQLTRAAATATPGPLRLLVAAESASALAAVEMTAAGVPWRADRHDELLAAKLGPRPPAGLPPARLRELADRISTAFGGRRVNPDSPADLLRAFEAAGVSLPSTRFAVLREVEHPAAPLLVEYKELSRLHAANGWAWLATWVAGGRFRPEYVPGGVVSGRWASRGGGALQIPHAVRGAVVADPGWVLVVADAAQLEPRVLAALAGDRGLAAAAGTGDLYTALAGSTFGGDRGRAKIALLSAMYGGVRGEAGALVAALRVRFPQAVGYVEDAARAGEQGAVVRSRLGRTCPPPSERWLALLGGPAGAEAGGEADADAGPRRGGGVAGQAARDRGRFTRNFVVQASAADWALVLLAALRRRLAALDSEPAPELVFFQHDEVVVHCPEAAAGAVVDAVTGAAAEASDLVFPGTDVRFPLTPTVVTCYADAK